MVSKELFPTGLDLTISRGKCSLSIPPGAVDKLVSVSACLLSDHDEYKNKAGVELTDVVQLLPHGTKLNKAATLKLRHNFTFRKKHDIKVTLLYESGTHSKKCMKPLCVFTALNRVVSLRFGHAILLTDQIIVHTTSFCHFCGRNDGCCFEFSMMILAPTELSLSQFRDGFSVKLSICKATEQKKNKAKNAERGRKGSQAFELIDSRTFELCECAISEDMDSPGQSTKKMPIIAEIARCHSAAWSIEGRLSEIYFSELQAISKGKRRHKTFSFVIGRSDSDHEAVGNSVTAWFTVRWTTPIEMAATFTPKNVSVLMEMISCITLVCFEFSHHV